MLDGAEADLRSALADTRLPDRADTAAIDAFLIDAHERGWRQ